MCAHRSDRDPGRAELDDHVDVRFADETADGIRDRKATGMTPPRADVVRRPRVVVGEPEQDGAVVHVAGRFRSSGSLYHWAAVRREGLWHLTGKDHPEPMLWADLVTWVEGSLAYADVTVMEPGAGR